jgi:hypothetical protein
MNDKVEHQVLADMAKLEETLTEDIGGDRVRAMVAYFEDVALTSEGLVRTATDQAERQLAGQLLEGFRAAQRVVVHVWETLHSTVLPA